ncbi:MAG: NAD(P)H-hydrate epimerase [Phycisphaeraceae bacterium]|nr:MAG: NAD(P)H-hydrate epimerase [Phycisphaeraceae bacterium]
MPARRADPVRVLTSAKARLIDRLAVRRYAIPSIVLMENAARALASEALAMLAGVPKPRVDLYCGPGNNGGDGFAAARHLHNAGVRARAILLAPARAVAGDAAVNLRILRRMKSVEVRAFPRAPGRTPDLIIDAIFGTGLTRPLGGRYLLAAERIAQHRSGGAVVLAADVPSGLHADLGEVLGPCVHADATVTFAGTKPGLLISPGPAGRVVVGDIGVPRALVEDLTTLFRRSANPGRRARGAGQGGVG